MSQNIKNMYCVIARPEGESGRGDLTNHKRLLLPAKSGTRNDNYTGFTLVELLVSVAILGILSVVSVNLLWNTVSVRAKQYSIQNSSENIRVFMNNLSSGIKNSKSLSIPSSQVLKITGDNCLTIKYDLPSKKIQEKVNSTMPCTPPDATESGFFSISPDEVLISTLTFDPVSNTPVFVTINLQGKYKDSLGEHPFSFNTTLYPRISI